MSLHPVQASGREGCRKPENVFTTTAFSIRVDKRREARAANNQRMARQRVIVGCQQVVWRSTEVCREEKLGVRASVKASVTSKQVRKRTSEAGRV